jgi:hypothetical protein
MEKEGKKGKLLGFLADFWFVADDRVSDELSH